MERPVEIKRTQLDSTLKRSRATRKREWISILQTIKRLSSTSGFRWDELIQDL